MTHDELLQKIDYEISNGLGLMAVAILGEGLKAVVKLHKPDLDGLICKECTASESEWYPCDTILAIRKGMES